MNDRRVGRVVREVRIRRGWRQEDLAAAAGVSQALISRIERGRIERLTVRRLRTIGAAMDISMSIDAWWRAGDVDRLIDRGHAALVEFVVGELRDHGWLTRVEVTFNNFGDRESADIVAWHPATRTLLIIEVKTRIGDVQATASTFERKVRILPGVLAREEGWDPAVVGRMLVIADTRANRAIVREHQQIFASIWPELTAATRRWIRKPTSAPTATGGMPRSSGSAATPGSTATAGAAGNPPPATARRGFGGIWFLPYPQLGSEAGRVRQVQRVRRPRPAA
jgi:transcriptional regulator with XRE-family HTH domain